MSASLDSLRFLLMDDNHHMRTIVATILRSVGARHLREASDGAEGLEVLPRPHGGGQDHPHLP